MKKGLQPINVRQAFEVEDIYTRKNYTFEYEPEKKEVHMYNTSRGVGKKLMLTYTEREWALYPTYCVDTPLHRLAQNPLEAKTAYDYFLALYNKATSGFNPTAMFLGWVNPDTIHPIEEEDENLDW